MKRILLGLGAALALAMTTSGAAQAMPPYYINPTAACTTAWFVTQHQDVFSRGMVDAAYDYILGSCILPDVQAPADPGASE